MPPFPFQHELLAAGVVDELALAVTARLVGAVDQVEIEGGVAVADGDDGVVVGPVGAAEVRRARIDPAVAVVAASRVAGVVAPRPALAPRQAEAVRGDNGRNRSNLGYGGIANDVNLRCPLFFFRTYIGTTT